MSARTLRFSLGEPRNLTVIADGSRVLFVRTPTGTDRTGALWAFEVATGTERLLADPVALLGDGGEQLSAQEQARRERARESAGGIVDFSVDDAGSTAVFALSGAIWVCELTTASCRELTTAGGAVIDPRIDPTGRTIGYATSSGTFRLIGVDGSADRAVAEPDGTTVVWGQAEFVAAEEMERLRGFWWAPDGSSLLVQRYDNKPVPLWYLADPADPSAAPIEHRYPVAGSADAEVSLWHVTLDGSQRELAATSADFPYLTSVSWTAHGDPVVQSMSRDQRRARIVSLQLDERRERTLAEPHDAPWIELVPGVPCLTPNGQLLTAVDDADSDTRRLAVDGAALSPAGLQIRSVETVADDGALVRASGADPTSIQLVRIGWDGTATELSSGPGVHQGLSAGGTTVISSSTLDVEGSTVSVFAGVTEVGTLHRYAEPAGLEPRVRLLRIGERQLATAVLFPSEHRAGSARLPVLMAPYGGPHGQQVLGQRRGFLQAQYLADQGFCVIVADGRGTPGRGPAWEKAVRDDFAGVTLQDQVDALAGVAEQYPDDVDTGRVGILGWSYGGYLSALAVLARPDVFHAAVAGAPVTDWRLYDTFYTERYLGHPVEQPAVYRRNSLLDLASQNDVPLPPLLILHGLVDDNVVVAHTLRLSSALLAAGRPHAILPLTGVTHMTPQEQVAENLLNLQVEFLQRALNR
ncbi:MAG: alpha/beta fold hydrolase [Actinomycetota bacterium]|nr:alpha/beta fold hydrolase [Actinomycetota bacterium]